MGKNKSTRSDGVTGVKKTQELEKTENKIPMGVYKKAPHSPK